MRIIVFLAATATFSSPIAPAFAQAPDSLSFQGLLTNSDGSLLDSSNVSITFTLYKGGAQVWTETQIVDVVDGIFNVLLGAVTPMKTLPFDQTMELGVKLDGEAAEISPRTPLVAAAFAKALPGLYTFYREQGTSQSYNVVAGGDNNSVGAAVTGATISGGGGIAVGNAWPNQVLENFGVIGGGSQNSVSGGTATIGGGAENSAEGGESVIGGGRSNTASGARSVVAGGGQNEASGSRSAVGGGELNTASGNRSVVAGGQDQTASGEYATIGGGLNHDATGTHSTVVGGRSGAADGDYSTVLGGRSNAAGGNYAMAAGHRADADHPGSFVWQDSSGAGFLTTTGPNQFLVRASGGFKFITSASSVIPDTGAELAAGSGSWADVSSESSKTGIKPINTRDYLDGVASLAIRKWSYKTEDPRITHVGPMAEDFHAVFGHGHSDASITTVDASGVALAAIQGLYEIVKEQQAEIERLKKSLAADR